MAGKQDLQRILALRVLPLVYQVKMTVDGLCQEMELTCDQGLYWLSHWADEADLLMQSYCRSIQKYDRMITCPVR
jgi:hypothetical protein